jgi:hypothetical protein
LPPAAQRVADVAAARRGEPPPVATPQAPLPPRFPELERPRPGYVEPDYEADLPKPTEPATPEATRAPGREVTTAVTPSVPISERIPGRMYPVTPEDIARHEAAKAEEARLAALPPVAKGWNELLGENFDHEDLATKPVGFDKEEAKSARQKLGLPEDWETFKQQGAIAIERGRGETRSDQELKREGQRHEREPLVQDALENVVGHEGLDKYRESLNAAAFGIPKPRPGEEQAMRPSGEEPHNVTLGREFLARAQKQIAAADAAMKKAAAQSRMRNIGLEPKSKHPVFRIPTVRPDGTVRGPGKDFPWYSRLADTVRFEHRLRNLIDSYDHGIEDVNLATQSRAEVRGRRTGALTSRIIKRQTSAEIGAELKKEAAKLALDVGTSQASKRAMSEEIERKYRGVDLEGEGSDAKEAEIQAGLERIAGDEDVSLQDELLERAVNEGIIDRNALSGRRARYSRENLRDDMLDHFQEQYDASSKRGPNPRQMYEAFRESVKTSDPSLYAELPELGAMATPRADTRGDPLWEKWEAEKEKNKKAAAAVQATAEGKTDEDGAISQALTRGLQDEGIVNTAERVRYGNDPGAYAQRATVVMNKRLGSHLRELADGMKRRAETIISRVGQQTDTAEMGRMRDEATGLREEAARVEGMARDAETNTVGRPEDVINRIFEGLDKGSDLWRDSAAAEKLADWFPQRVRVDQMIRALELQRPRGEIAAPPRHKQGPAVAPDIVGTQIPEVGKISREAPVTPKVTPREEVPDRLRPETASHVADMVLGDQPLPDLPPKLVKDAPVRSMVSSIIDRTTTLDPATGKQVSANPIDEHLADMAKKIIPNVRVMELHSDVYDEVMKRVAPDVQSDGYYDWKSDRIYLRNQDTKPRPVTPEPPSDEEIAKMSDADKRREGQRTIARTAALMSSKTQTAERAAEQRKALAKHELMHALVMGALERDPAARARIENIMQTVRDKGQFWKGGLDAGQQASIMRKLNDVHEFLSEVWSNDEFQRTLAGVPITPAERARWAAPQARTILQAFVDKVRQMVTKMFKAASPDNALNEALIQSADLLHDVRAQGRPLYAGEARTGAPGILDDMMHRAGFDLKRAMHPLRRSAEDIGLATRYLTTRTDQLPGLAPHDMRDLGEAAVREIARTNKLVDTYRNADAPLQKEISDWMAKPQGDEIARFFLDESKLRARADKPLDERDEKKNRTGPNKHVDASLRWQRTREDWDRMNKWYQRLAQIPGFDAFHEKLMKYGHDEGRKIARAQVSDSVQHFEPLVKDDKGENDPTAVSALTKTIMSEKDLTQAEREWVSDKSGGNEPDPLKMTVQHDNFAKLLEKYRALPGLRLVEDGPYFPHKRHGDLAAIGDYELNDPAKEGGHFVVDEETDPRDHDTVEFPTEQGLKDYTKRHVAEGPNTAMLNYERRVYDKTTGKVAMREAEKHTLEGGKPGTDEFVVVSREGHEERVPAATVLADLKKKPEDRNPDYKNLEVRYLARFNNKYYSQHATHYDAMNEIEKARSDAAKNGVKLNMRPEPEEVRDWSKVKAPGFLDDQLKQLIRDFKRSPEYRRMMPAERKSVMNRIMSDAAQLVMRAGGRMGGMTREYVEGASRDMLESYLEMSAQKATALAYAERGEPLRQALEAMDKFTNERVHSAGNNARRLVTDTLAERAYRVEDPIVHGWLRSALGRLQELTYNAKLMGTSFMGINTMEPGLLGGPMLAAMEGSNPAKAFSTMKKHYGRLMPRKLFGAGYNDMVMAARHALNLKTDRKWTDYEETVVGNLMRTAKTAAERAQVTNEYAPLFRHFAELGMFDPDALNQVTLMRQPKATMLGRWMTNISNVFRGANNAVEVMNRAVLGLSAYDIAKPSGVKMANGLDLGKVRAAENLIYKAAGVYNRWNAPPVFNHPLAAPMFVFKKYGQRVISNYIAAAIGTKRFFMPPEGATEIDKAEYKVQAKQFAMMLTMQGMAAGVMGLPLEMFAVPVNAMYATGLIDQNYEDLQNDAYKFLAANTTPDIAQVVAHGGIDYLTGASVSGRISHNNLMFNRSIESTKPKDMLTSLAGVAFGAPGDQGMQLVAGTQEAAHAVRSALAGEYDDAQMHAEQAARHLSPIRQLSDVLDTYRMSMGDTTTRTRGGAALGPELNTWDKIVRLGGFTPTRVARAQEQRAVEKRDTTRFTADRQERLAAYAQASPDTRGTVSKNIDEWNDSHPASMRISESDKMRAVAQRRKQEGRPGSEMGLTLTKRTQPLHEEYSRLYGNQ